MLQKVRQRTEKRTPNVLLAIGCWMLAIAVISFLILVGTDRIVRGEEGTDRVSLESTAASRQNKGYGKIRASTIATSSRHNNHSPTQSIYMYQSIINQTIKQTTGYGKIRASTI